jgi:Fic family protein
LTTIFAMEPLLPERGRELEDLGIDLVESANRFSGQLHSVLRSTLGDLTRSMNCYYSNLIEGHNTHPVDIDRALAGDYALEPKKRNLQLEARAHIEVQAMIDRGDMPAPPATEEGILWLHREFCARLPGELLLAADPETGREEAVVPGALRTHHVKVGRHIAPDPAVLPALLARFTEVYSGARLSRLDRLLAVGAAHHRLAWVHPFTDGNGRVARLMSHAMLRELGVGSELWSVSRGLARGVKAYKDLLAAADEPRRGDLDGRGNLTQRGLDEFSTFFLRSCVDQVKFMQSLMQPEELLTRMEIWTEEEIRNGRILKGSWPLLREAVLAGEFPRSRAELLTGYQERQARKALSLLLDRGVLVSDSPRGKLRLGFPIGIIERWLPRLYPATT